MNEKSLRQLLDDVRAGSRTVDDAVNALRHLPFEDLGFAKLDHHRTIRCGFPEVILAEGKTPEQVAALARCSSQADHNLLITRASAAVFELVRQDVGHAQYHESARAISVRHQPPRPTAGICGIISAGTGDIPAAEEALVTLDIMDQRTMSLYDVGVAGIHRLFGNLEKLNDMSVIIVAAGMDGALPSVIGGLVNVPVIALPTSVGYGASFGGVAALLTMLNSCAAGVTVVNIDNGFGAACAAAAILRQVELSKTEAPHAS